MEIRDERRVGWYRIDNHVLDQYGKEIGVYGLAIYNVLARHANRAGVCYPSIARLAAVVRCSRGAIKRYLDVLESCGLIAVEPRAAILGEPDTNLYRLLDLSPGDRVGRQVTEGRSPGDRGVGHQVAMNKTTEEQDLVTKTQMANGSQVTGLNVEASDPPPGAHVVPPRGEPGAPNPSGTKSKRIIRGIPDDFALTDERATFAREAGCTDPSFCFRKFQTHYRGVAQPKRGWAATWELWSMNHRQYGCSAEASARNGQRPPERSEASRRYGDRRTLDTDSPEWAAKREAFVAQRVASTPKGQS